MARKPSPTTTSAAVNERQVETFGLILFALSFLALISLVFGRNDTHFLSRILGWAALPTLLISASLGAYLAFRRVLAPRIDDAWHPEALLGVELFLVAALTASSLRLGPESYLQGTSGRGGGIVGWGLAELLRQSVGTLAAWGILIGLGLIGLYLVYAHTPLHTLELRWRRKPPPRAPEPARPTVRELPAPRPAERPAERPAPRPTLQQPASRPAPRPIERPIERPAEPEPEPEPVWSVEPAPPKPRPAYKLPPITLLKGEDKKGSGTEQAQAQARIIEETLTGFGIPAKVVEINVGPTVTQFGVSPGTVERAGKQFRVRVNKIVALTDDLALALAASPVRIEAPVPGRPFVGIEVPNPGSTLVSLRRILADKTYKKNSGLLTIPFGRDVSGAAVGSDLHKLPHLLVAGATGSGKSVALNAILCALLFTHSPDTLQLILIDPKRVEFPGYNGIPHLIAPVVTDAEHAGGALSWLLVQMDARYRLFSEKGVRNIESYNGMVGVEQQLPYIVTVIDELADLMMMAPDAIEAKLVRLAQMARATGIHLIVATQRPSVDVVTGLIKANFPARLAFAVTSQIDSRVILDSPGAEKLLGRGDGLLMTSDSSKLRRIQGCFVSDNEINAVVEWWNKNYPPPPRNPTQPLYPWSQLLVEEANADDLVQQAIEAMQGRQTISTSGLQRLLNIGYPRAARLMEELEAAGVVGPESDRRSGRPVLLDAYADDADFDDFDDYDGTADF